MQIWIMLAIGSFFLKDLLFDLGDPLRWEFLLLGTDKPILSLPEVEEEEELVDDEVEDLVSDCACFSGSQVSKCCANNLMVQD